MSNVTQTSSPYFYVSRKRYQRYPSPIPQPQLPAPTGNFTLIRDVEYGRGGDVSLKLDIYIPETPLALPMPAVIFIHGGGWEGGDKYPGQITSLVRRGFFGVSINYRLSGVAPFPAAIEDCKCAETKLLGGTMEQKPEVYRQASPATWVSPDDPPLLLVHGDQDTIVPFRQSLIMHDAYKGLGLDVTLIRVVGAGHGFINRLGQPLISPSPQEIERAVHNFFLKRPG